jgi:hypothetical protein
MPPTQPVLVSCLFLAILTGCGVTPPARYYILTPVEDSGAETSPGPALGIGPIDFPGYLDRPELAHRNGSNQLYFADSDRWAEPLKATFSRTLAENLEVMLPTDQVSLYPWPRTTRVDYQISIDVSRFDADASGMVVLTAGWKILRPDDGIVFSSQRGTYTESGGGLVYPAIVAAQSRALKHLCQDITASIKTLDANPGTSTPGTQDR